MIFHLFERYATTKDCEQSESEFNNEEVYSNPSYEPIRNSSDKFVECNTKCLFNPKDP